MKTQSPIFIEGRRQVTLAVSAAAAQTAVLEEGTYDVWCDVDVWIKVDEVANDVTTANGYKISAGNTIPVRVPFGRKIGAIAGGAGTLSYHQVAD